MSDMERIKELEAELKQFKTTHATSVRLHDQNNELRHELSQAYEERNTLAARLAAAEEALRDIYNGLVEINPNNHDEDDVFTQNNSVIESIQIAAAIIESHAPATPQADHIGEATGMVQAEPSDRERRLEEALRNLYELNARGVINVPDEHYSTITNAAVILYGEEASDAIKSANSLRRKAWKTYSAARDWYLEADSLLDWWAGHDNPERTSAHWELLDIIEAADKEQSQAYDVYRHARATLAATNNT